MQKRYNKKINISVGIAAYNAEKNINHLITSILKQKSVGFNLKRIIIHSDMSTDNTVKIVKRIKDKRIRIMDNKIRKGFGGSVKSILKETSEDVIILFNDDIIINDLNLLSKLVKPFITEAKIGLVCGHPLPLDPISFIDGSINSSHKAYDRMKESIKKGNSVFSCDGKTLALSREFLKYLKFPKNNKEMGNVDNFIYFTCITSNFKFRYVKDAKVYYRPPTTYSDYINWFTRNNSHQPLKKRFGDIVDQEYRRPPFLFWSSMLPEFFLNPLGSTFIFVTGIYIKYRAHKYGKNFISKWEVISTTKDI